MTQPTHAPGPIPCRGAVCGDFRLTDQLPPEQAPAVIERDRLLMAARPGFDRKLLPLRVEPACGMAYSGGRYLFDSYADAVAYRDWCRDAFVIDGVRFLERADFADFSMQVFRVIGAEDFQSLRAHQCALRTEIWRSEDLALVTELPSRWASLRARAQAAGCASLWLLHSEEDRDIALVTVWDRVGQPPADAFDFATLDQVEGAPSFAGDWEGRAHKRFDRSHWILTIWLPNDARQQPPLWPNSPPLPAPGQPVKRTAAGR